MHACSYKVAVSCSSLQHSGTRNLSIATGSPADEIARMNFDPSCSSTSSNGLLAYRPRFSDAHTSSLGVIFVNVQANFPCLSGARYPVICNLFTYDDDGLRNGHATIEAGDTHSFGGVFGTNSTLAIGFSGCPTMSNDCFPNSGEYTIVCLLPRNDRCG